MRTLGVVTVGAVAALLGVVALTYYYHGSEQGLAPTGRGRAWEARRGMRSPTGAPVPGRGSRRAGTGALAFPRGGGSRLPLDRVARPRAASAGALVTGIEFYAWYAAGDEVTYHELHGLPADDEKDPYPVVDVIVTVTNLGAASSPPFSLRTQVAYRVGRLSADETEQAYARSKSASTWGRDEALDSVNVPSLDPGETRRVRTAALPMATVWPRYWQRGMWPFAARVSVLAVPEAGDRGGEQKVSEELAIEMLD
jgi:hypothetical protein